MPTVTSMATATMQESMLIKELIRHDVLFTAVRGSVASALLQLSARKAYPSLP